jgi:hypothetical protein
MTEPDLLRVFGILVLVWLLGVAIAVCWRRQHR